jgi:hypothetical protein
MRLVVEAPQALNHRLLHLVEAIGGLAAIGIDPQDRVVVQLDLEVRRPAAIAAKPGGAIPVELGVVHR